MLSRTGQLLLAVLLSCFSHISKADDSTMFRKISDEIMLRGKCYENLRSLCKNIGHRLSGTPEAEKAVLWAQITLKEAGADTVWLQPVEVPYWYRGKELLSVQFPGSQEFVQVPALSLGNSEGTKGQLWEAELFICHDLKTLQETPADQIKGKIVFFNFRFPQEHVNTFHGYGQTARYRSIVPNTASAKGALAVIIRSVSTGEDDVPHTGVMSYADSVKPIPAMAIGNFTANKLEKSIHKGKIRVRMQSECTMKEPVLSYNVIGEIKGSVFPEEIIIAGGHLDSWDVGEGAHDDGSGCVQSIEIIRTFKQLGIKPKRTIRAVMFMNEENGLKGGIAYADSAKAAQEKHIFALESDAGAGAPRGIGLKMSEARRNFVRQFRHLFLPYGVYDFEQQYGGADISPLEKQGVPVAGLYPDPQRYFDLHHTSADVFEAVNHRELKLGAVAMTQLIYLVSEYGLGEEVTD
jgi:carboxypeptidase Q